MSEFYPESSPNSSPNSSPLNSDNEESDVTIINPYNFNNKMISTKDITNILSKFDIHLEPNNLDLYQNSFIHKSYTKKDPNNYPNEVEIAERPEGAIELFDYDNERLEFLGDSVLSAITAKYLYERYSDQNEGFLTRMRTKLVNGTTLGKFAKGLNFGELVIISRHVEDKCDGRNSENILEDVFEAFFGALFLDFNEIVPEDSNSIFENFYSGIGFQVCEQLFVNLIEDTIDFTDLILNDTNYKDQLLRYFQQEFGHPPKYKGIMVEGVSKDRVFTVGVLDSDGEVIIQGSGKSKKKAEQDASKNALIHFNKIKLN
jgi:ribonuclease III